MLDDRRGRPVRIARLIRVSTDHVEQADSPQHQLSYLGGEANREGWVDSGLVYTAELTGAVIIDRPDIQRMLADARSGLFDAVVLKSISRLGRDALGLLMVKRMLDDLGVEVIAVSDGYRSFRDPEIIFLVFAERAQAGRIEISKAVRAGIVEAAKRGIWPAGTLPFGLRKTSRFEVDLDPETAPIVRLIFELRKQYKGVVAICRHLNNELKVKAPEWWHLRQQIRRLEETLDVDRDDRLQRKLTRLKERMIAGQFLWYPKTVRVLLSNTAYYGELCYNRTTGERKMHGRLVRMPRSEAERVVIPCAPLVERSEWDLAQAVGERRAQMPRKSLASQFLLSGIIVCGRCGHAMRGSSARPGAGRRGGDPKGYYICRGSVEAGVHKADYVRATDLEQSVIRRLRHEVAMLETPQVQRTRKARKPADRAREISAVEAAIADLAEARFFRREELRKGRMSQADFDAELEMICRREEDLRQRLELLRRGLSQARDEEVRVRAVDEAVRRLQQLEGEPDELKALLPLLIKKVVVHSATEVEVHTSLSVEELSEYQTIAD